MQLSLPSLNASEAAPVARLIIDDKRLIRVAVDLGATEIGGPLSPEEMALANDVACVGPTDPDLLSTCRTEIALGRDPLGVALCRIRTAKTRRSLGAFYTSPEIIESMVKWIADHKVARIVDPGCGSGRFAVYAAATNPNSEIIAADVDPVATLITRAALRVVGAKRATVLNADYTMLQLPSIADRTGFVGNPPYVRHHDVSQSQKSSARQLADRLGIRVSLLAGLHTYFFLSTALNASKGDVGCFITSAEWLDVNYGEVLRELLLGVLGGTEIYVFPSKAILFSEVMTTAAITCFEAGSKRAAMRMNPVTATDMPRTLDSSGGAEVLRTDLEQSQRWSSFFRPGMPQAAKRMRLGDIARVHRGQVTGANSYFVMSRLRAKELGIEQWCKPAITRAREIFEASSGVIRDDDSRMVLFDAPPDVDRALFPMLDAYLRLGEARRGSDAPIAERFIPKHRRPWWKVNAPAPPIVATYMARQAPFFALNPDGLVLLNIAHGIYPRSANQGPQEIVDTLNSSRSTFIGLGRTYHGGLEKFEPKEMEALPIPAGPR